MVSTPDYAENLMREFRRLVVGLQEQQHELREKLETQSSSDISTTSRPPSYKTVLKQIHDPNAHPSLNNNNNNNDIPEPPKRTKRKSATLSNINTRSSSSGNSNIRHHINPTMSATVTAAAAAATASRGAFIVLEGLDRVGKSTLAKNLVEHLKKIKRPVTYFRFPDRTTPVGHLIEDFLKTSSKNIDEHVIHLLFSANRWELAKTIRNTIQRGTTVVADRYSYSGLAYSSAKKNLSLEWCRGMERGLPRPDLVVYLELPVDAQLTRPGFGDERFETRDMQDLVRIQYEKVMEISNETWLRIDVENKSPDQVLGEIIMPVKRCLESSKFRELGDLDFF